MEQGGRKDEEGRYFVRGKKKAGGNERERCKEWDLEGRGREGSVRDKRRMEGKGRM